MRGITPSIWTSIVPALPYFFFLQKSVIKHLEAERVWRSPLTVITNTMLSTTVCSRQWHLTDRQTNNATSHHLMCVL